MRGVDNQSIDLLIGGGDMDVGPGTGASHLGAAFSTVRTSVVADAATKLGISIGQLRAELAAGTPLADIAAVAGMSVSRPVTEQRGGTDVLL